MFWRFNYMPSRVDSILDKEDVTLQELMDEDDVVQECKSQNRKLVDFLIQPEIMETLVNMAIGPPSESTDEKLRYKYPNVACDLITADVTDITDAIAGSDTLLNAIYAFLESDSELNPLQASFFSKVMGLLITRKSQMTLDFLKSRENFIDQLLRHLGVSAIMDVLLRLITCIESPECRNDCINWLNEQRLVSRLVSMIDAQHSAEKHTNAAQSLCDIIRLSREQLSSLTPEPSVGGDALLSSIETTETVTSLLDHMLNGDHVESVLVNGLYVLQTLLECRKVSGEGIQEPLLMMDDQQTSPGVINTVNAVVARLKDFHQLLITPPRQHYMPMPTSVGIITVPLGQTRLQIARLLSMLIMTNIECVSVELSTLGTLSVLLDLFFQYPWNNFLHAHVEQCIAGVLTTTHTTGLLQTQLLNEFHLLERIAEAFEGNRIQQMEPGQRRRGYMGHLTRIANQLAGSMVPDSDAAAESQHISSVFEGLPDPVREQWNECVAGSLAEINKLNTVELVGGSTGLLSSSDDDEEFRTISFPQDDALQKAFSDYQQQKMTSDFVEQFGFSEEEFADQEDCIGSPFNERISTISFELNSVEDSPTAAAMFEHACSDRIRQFDTTDSDEELWEDKDLSFTRLTDNRHSPPNRLSEQSRLTDGSSRRLTRGGTRDRGSRGVADSDEDGEEYEEDERQNFPDSDDSDPEELVSPRFIRQTDLCNSSDDDTITDGSTPPGDTTQHTAEAADNNELETNERPPISDVNCVGDGVKQSGDSRESDKAHECYVSSETVDISDVNIDVDVKSSSVDGECVDLNALNSEMSVDISNKLDPFRMPCHVDACAASVDTLACQSVPNGPV